MGKFKSVTLGVLSLLALTACKQKQAVPTYNDSWYSGTAKFAVDEALAPIVDEEAYVFKALNKKADPVMIYAPEGGVINLLLEDSVRVAVLSRALDSSELKVLAKRNLSPDTSHFAIGAVALIVNKVSNDTLITMDEIKKTLVGQANSSMNIVFDNANSSLVRSLKALTGISDFKPKNIFALKSNKEVIKYVSTHTGAIGITDFSWLDDPDKDYADAVDNVKIMAVKNESDKKYGTQYFKPSQSTLYLKQYPLRRDLYIVNCSGRPGLGTGFAKFVMSDRGQRIILKSGLLPVEIPEREILLKKTLN